MNVLVGPQQAALVMPPQSVPFKLAQPTAATCNAALARPWEIGDWTNTDLNPFDNGRLLEHEISTLPMCRQAANLRRKGEPEYGECSTCDYGWIYAEHGRGTPQCREAPLCDGTMPGKQCTMSALTPWLVVPCESCIQAGCSPYSGMSSCNEL